MGSQRALPPISTSIAFWATKGIRWGVVLVLVIVFAVAFNYWVFKAELSSGGANIAGGNPPVPVLLALILLLPLQRFLRLTDTELAVFYLSTAFVFLPATLGGVRAFFPSLTTPFYYAAPDNSLKEFWHLLPDWWVPKDASVIQGFFEGANGRVPWNSWLPVLVRWSLFFLALWAMGSGVAWLMAPRWIKAERLNFPIAQLPLQMIEGIDGRPFFTLPLAWWGILVGAIPTAFMAVCSLYRPIERFWDLGAYFTDRPFSVLRPLLIYPLVEGVGFGYFVPQDALFSVWFSYFVLKLMNFIGIGILGWDIPDFPFPHAQCFGGYLAMAAILFMRTARQTKQNEPMAVWMLIVGCALVLTWMIFSGMRVPLALLYTFVLLSFTVTYARVRAELGMPYTNVHPYGAQREFWHLFGMSRMLQLGGKKGLVVLVGLFWLVRRFLLFQIGAYSADAVKLAVKVKLSAKKVLAFSFIGYFIGLWAAFISHLFAYYCWGANYLEGAPGTGDYRTYEAAQDYRVLGWLLNAMSPASWWHVGFALYGAASVLLLAFLRKIFPNFPIHPLGFILGSAYGHHCPYWFPTFFVWAVKGAILHYSGLRGHRRFIPFFLGLALGHFLVTGAIWAGIIYPAVRGRWGYPLRILFQ